MMVMPANNSKMLVGYLAGKYPDRIGWIISPGGWRRPPFYMPFAIDNGAFSCWQNGKQWSKAEFLHLLKLSKPFKPMWVAVPDVVADRDATLKKWDEWYSVLKSQNIPLAFVVQDGMTESDVPEQCDFVFVGGSTKWKWENLYRWKSTGKPIHVGRVNTGRMLWMAHNSGAVSCDGTGWFRGDKKQLYELLNYLEESTSGIRQIDFGF